MRNTVFLAWRAGTIVALIWLATAGPSAHSLDEFTQAARVNVGTSRTTVTLDLRPGVEVASGIVSTIDRNGDEAVSADEAAAYVQQVLAAVSLEVEGQPHSLVATSWQFPTPSAMRTGEAFMRLEFVGTYAELAPGPHVVTFKNGHRADVGVYLMNALVPSDPRVNVTTQDRDAKQTALRIAVDVGPSESAFASSMVLVLVGAGVVLVMVLIRRTIDRA